MSSVLFHSINNGYSKRHRMKNEMIGYKRLSNRFSPVYNRSNHRKQHEQRKQVQHISLIPRLFKRLNKFLEMDFVLIVIKWVGIHRIKIDSSSSSLSFRSNMGFIKSRCFNLYGLCLITSKSWNTSISCSIVRIRWMAVGSFLTPFFHILLLCFLQVWSGSNHAFNWK